MIYGDNAIVEFLLSELVDIQFDHVCLISPLLLFLDFTSPYQDIEFNVNVILDCLVNVFGLQTLDCEKVVSYLLFLIIFVLLKQSLYEHKFIWLKVHAINLGIIDRIQSYSLGICENDHRRRDNENHFFIKIEIENSCFIYVNAESDAFVDWFTFVYVDQHFS